MRSGIWYNVVFDDGEEIKSFPARTIEDAVHIAIKYINTFIRIKDSVGKIIYDSYVKNDEDIIFQKKYKIKDFSKKY